MKSCARVGALPVDRDLLEFAPEMTEGIDADADVEQDDDAGWPTGGSHW